MDCKSMWRQLGLLLILTALFVGNTAPMLAAFRNSAPATATPAKNIAASHSEYCHCKACAGERACCCKPSGNPLATLVMKSACDLPDDLLQLQTSTLYTLPEPFAMTHIVNFIGIAPTVYSRFEVSHSPEIISPPPRSL